MFAELDRHPRAIVTTLVLGADSGAAALARADRAEQLIDEVEATFAAARDTNPDFDGATGVIALIGEDGNYYPYGPADARARLLSDLGFTQQPEITRLAGDRFFATISAGRFDLLNADVLVWAAESQAVVALGRDVFLPPNGALGAALSYNNALSLPFVIDGMMPLLQAAVDGDPNTAVPAA